MSRKFEVCPTCILKQRALDEAEAKLKEYENGRLDSGIRDRNTGSPDLGGIHPYYYEKQDGGRTVTLEEADWKAVTGRLVQAEARVADYKGNYDTLHAEYEKQKARVRELEKEVERLGDRDCHATIQLILPNEYNPFDKIDLKVVDVGVADNIYVCRSKEVEELQTQLATAREALENLLLLIEHETGLPESAANGVTHMGLDEGIVKTSEILNNAKKALGEIGGGE